MNGTEPVYTGYMVMRIRNKLIVFIVEDLAI